MLFSQNIKPKNIFLPQRNYYSLDIYAKDSWQSIKSWDVSGWKWWNDLQVSMLQMTWINES